MATANLKFINLPLPRPSGSDPTTKEGKIERAFLEWATQIVRALQSGTVEIPATAALAATSPAATSSAAALAASAATGPTSSALPTGPAGGDLSGNYPDPRVERLQGRAPGDAAFARLADIYANVSAMVTNLLPAGAIVQWPAALADVPTGWLLCDGTIYNIADHATLGVLLGAKYGGDGVTTFGVPDTNALFMLGTTTDADIGTTGGTAQHKHAVGTLLNDSVSAGTPAGTVSQPTLTMNSYTPSGTVSQPTFTGNPVAAASTAATPDLVMVDATAAGVSPVTTATGTVSQPTFTGDAAVLTGTVSQPTFTGAALGTHTHTISGKTDIAENLAGSTADEDVLPPWLKLAFIIKT